MGISAVLPVRWLGRKPVAARVHGTDRRGWWFHSRGKHYTGLLLAAWFLSAVSALPAAPLYLELVERAEVDDETLEAARKQIKDHKAITVIDELPLPPFHRRKAMHTTARQPFCQRCHLPLPHRQDERARTFLNMHSRFIACETCHLRPDGVEMAYRWLAYDGEQAGQPLPNRIAATEGENSSIVPRAGARIAPFHAGEAALIFGDHPFAERVEQRWKEGTEEERTELKARLHAPLSEEGPACRGCHGERSPLLDLQALGASPQELRALRQNTVVRFFERFEDDEKRLRIDELLR